MKICHYYYVNIDSTYFELHFLDTLVNSRYNSSVIVSETFGFEVMSIYDGKHSTWEDC